MTYIFTHIYIYMYVEKKIYTYNHVCKVPLFEDSSRLSGLPRFHVCSKACPSGYSLYSSAGSEVTWDLEAICIVWYAWNLGPPWISSLTHLSEFCYKLIWDFVNLISRPFMDVYPQRNPHFLCWQNNSSANKLHPFLTAHRGDHESLP